MDKKKSCLSVSQIEEWLKEAGVNATAQRIAICRYVLCEADHPTADEVKQWADANFPKISLATVYNTLNTLVDTGLLREYRFTHSGKTVYDDNLVDHYHFIDEKTQQLIDLDPSAVSLDVSSMSNVSIRKIDVVLYGNLLEEGKE